MRSEDELLDLMGRIYDAGAGTRPWSECLGQMAAMLKSRAAVVQVMDLATRRLVRLDHVNVEEEEIEEYDKYYVSLSPRIEFGRKKPFGHIFSDYELISESEIGKNEFYADFLAKWGFRYFAGGAFPIAPGLLGHFSIQRTPREGHVEEGQIRLLERLFPHVRCAMEQQWRLNRSQQERDNTADALDRVTHGVIFVTASGRMIRANRIAGQILLREDGLRVTDGLLRAVTQSDTDRLDSLIGRAVQTSSGKGFDAGGAISIERPSMRRPLYVLVSPLRSHARGYAAETGNREAAAVLFVHDPEANAKISGEILQDLYGLTPAEARLTEALVSGEPLTAAAERFAISTGTARTQLKAIFVKTGTHRQSDLIGLILSGPITIYTL